MGLTIHYTLASEANTPEDARVLINRLRDRALEMPFADVGEMIEFESQSPYGLWNLKRDDPHKWLKIQACHLLPFKIGREESWVHVPPSHLIAFTIRPGDGCEHANFGLCQYPETVINNRRRIPTQLAGWSWASFCKTQYASNPTCGGLPNFVRCHVGLVKLLDYAAELGLLAEVKDESKYFQTRDATALGKELARWNEVIAGAVGTMKDTLDPLGKDAQAIIAEITKFPNFEHLEAKGRDQTD